MLRIRSTIVVLFLIEALSMADIPKDKVVIITHEIFPTASVDGKRVIPFVPTWDQIRVVEEKLQTYLKKDNPQLLKKLSKYFRQYTGLEIVGGMKKIRANFLCQVVDDRWKKEWVEVDDGGDCFFNFSYDLDKGVIFEFQVNGWA